MVIEFLYKDFNSKLKFSNFQQISISNCLVDVLSAMRDVLLQFGTQINRLPKLCAKMESLRVLASAHRENCIWSTTKRYFCWN